MKNSKKLALIILALVLILLTACSGGGKEDKVDVSMLDLSKAMLDSSDKFKEMAYASSEDTNPDRLLKGVCEIDYSKVSAFFISYATNGSKNADEIVVVALNDAKDVKEAQAALEKHVEYRKGLYATYDPTQSPKLLASKIFTFKNLAVLIVADDVKAVENAFYDFVKK